MTGRRAVLGLVATTALLLAACGPTSTDLGTLGGSTSSGTDIQADGVVVGMSRSAQGFDHAFRYDPLTRGMIDLHPQGYAFSGAAGISDGGLIAGTVVTNDLRTVGWAWNTATGSSGPLDKNAALDHVVPTAVSSDGSIVGYGVTAGGLVSSVSWDRDGTFHGEPATWETQSIATDVDDHGRTIGVVGPLSFPNGAYVSDAVHGRRALLATGFGPVTADGMNDVGDIVGAGVNQFNGLRAPMSWNADTLALTILPTLGGPPMAGFDAAGLVDVNDDGIAVGWSTTGARPGDDPPRHAFCVSLRTGHTVDLGVATATAINDAGVIAGTKDGRAVTWPAGSCSH